MKIQYINEPEQYMDLFDEVEMDKGITYFKKGEGLKTYGVSSCIAFVAYYRNEPLCMLHWSTPASDASLVEFNDSVTSLLRTIARNIAMNRIPLNEVTIYALGGQHSSYHAITSLYIQNLLGNQPFNLNVDFLFIAPYEDCFDLYVSPGATTFWLVHHHVPVSASEVAHANSQVTNSFEKLALYCYELYNSSQIKCEVKTIEMNSKDRSLSCWSA